MTTKTGTKTGEKPKEPGLTPLAKPQSHTSVAEAVRCVQALLSEKRRWTKNAGARNAARGVVEPRDPGACKVCLEGAVSRCVVDPIVKRRVEARIKGAIETLFPAYKEQAIYGFNDAAERRYEDVAAVLERAVADAADVETPAQSTKQGALARVRRAIKKGTE